MPEGATARAVEDINIILDGVEEEANIQYDEPTIDSIKDSLDTLGYDVDSQTDRLNSIITVLLYNNEWNTDSAIRLMEALEDDHISEQEILTILNYEEISQLKEDVLDAKEADVKIDLELIKEYYDNLFDMSEMGWEDTEYTAEVITWTPLDNMLIALTNNIGERLEKFIANAIGIERKD